MVNKFSPETPESYDDVRVSAPLRVSILNSCAAISESDDVKSVTILLNL